ncbi:MAG: hypothetical protein JWP97_5055 [Labilithrix sp.]|nr:hypothetical protein [Labilithrix sp.]
MPSLRLSLASLACVLATAACAAPADEPIADASDEVKVDTRSPAARAQYDANVSFANDYVARCTKTNSGRPRVLVTGFGRFMSINDNATGRIVAKLVPGAKYPETSAPPPGTVDPPGPQLDVVQSTLVLPRSGTVDVCAMILPVYWDLASILIAKELESFQPDFVMMNGVAGNRQPLWIELGATNRGSALDDGSNQLRPAVREDESSAPLVQGGEAARANLLSWKAVFDAAGAQVRAHEDDVEKGVRLGDVLGGVKLAGFPRGSNTYLCNNITYVTGYLMDHPLRTVRLLRASPALPGRANDVKVRMSKSFAKTPRVFVHWPSEMATMHHAAGADVMAAILDAQVSALTGADAPVRGDNDDADPTLAGGAFF